MKKKRRSLFLFRVLGNHRMGWYISLPYAINFDLTLQYDVKIKNVVPWTGWKTTVVPLVERGYWGSALTSEKNTSTCAGRRGRVSGKRDTAMPSAKPCCMLPVRTQTVRDNSSRTLVVPLTSLQGILLIIIHIRPSSSFWDTENTDKCIFC